MLERDPVSGRFAPTARPFSQPLLHALGDCIRAGISYEAACRALGIDPRHGKHLAELGRNGHPLFQPLAEAVADARRERDLEVDRLLARLRHHVNGHSPDRARVERHQRIRIESGAYGPSSRGRSRIAA